MSNECQMKKSMEEWNEGTLEYWVEKKVFSFLGYVPSFQYSIIPE
jgi:hypothetical protein